MSQRLAAAIDVGGTFTDVVVLRDGEVTTTKVDSTPEDFSKGCIAGLEKVATKLGMTSQELLRQLSDIINGSTVVTNAFLGLSGVKTGLIVTKGFRDTMRIARIPKLLKIDLLYGALPELAPYDCTEEVTERVDWKGQVVAPLNKQEASEAVRRLVDEKGVESIAVCLLWSFQNPEHEEEIEKLINEMYPGTYVAISSRSYPVIREYERMVTTVLDAYTGPLVMTYARNLEQGVRDRGFDKSIRIMQSSGGVFSPDDAQKAPSSLLMSGPVGGVVAANYIAGHEGIRNLITMDVGGTSFDTALLYNNEMVMTLRAWVGGFLTGLTMADIRSIGAGGGSIAWIDPRGIPQVGPQSAGSVPGPACYGRGGTEPTVTDALVCLGVLEPGSFLGGEMKIFKGLAEKAVKEKFAEPLGMNLVEASSSIWRLVVASMSNAVGEISVERGYDPRDFASFAYGGLGGTFASEIAKALGIRTCMVPGNSGVFSAYGLSIADRKKIYVKSYHWRPPEDFSRVNEVFHKLTEAAKSEFGANAQFLRECDLRFVGQVYETAMSMPDRDLADDDLQPLRERFTAVYEETRGKGTAWVQADIEIINCRVIAIEPTVKIPLQEVPKEPPDPSSSLKGKREVFLPVIGVWEALPIYDYHRLRPGMVVQGPAIVEATDSTTVVPPDATLEMDGLMMCHISL